MGPSPGKLCPPQNFWVLGSKVMCPIPEISSGHEVTTNVYIFVLMYVYRIDWCHFLIEKYIPWKYFELQNFSLKLAPDMRLQIAKVFLVDQFFEFKQVWFKDQVTCFPCAVKKLTISVLNHIFYLKHHWVNGRSWKLQYAPFPPFFPLSFQGCQLLLITVFVFKIQPLFYHKSEFLFKKF